MKHELISLTEFPTMPAPWSSQDVGEAWVWGDYFATIQKEPITIAQGVKAMSGENEPMAVGIEYPYAMTVFYHKAKNPHGPSGRPIMTIGLEKANYQAVAAMMGLDRAALAEATGSADGGLMLGMFKGASRQNLGSFDGSVTLENVRNAFFAVMAKELQLSGRPEKIGTIEAAYGHPMTGWEASKNAKSSSGCLGMVVLGIGVALSLVLGIDFLI